MTEKKPYHGGNLLKAAEKYGFKPQEFIDFSANINPLGPSPKVISAIKADLDMIRHYPEPEAEILKGHLSEFLKVPSENLLLGNGAAELIYLLGRVFDSRRIVLAAPCFSEYGEGTEKSTFKYINLDPHEDFQIKASSFINEIQEKDVVYIGNPNNPTGGIVEKKELLKIYLKCHEKSAVLIVDEAFIDFVDDELGTTLRFEAVNKDDLIVLGSLTKFFAIPALRLGYLITSTSNIKRFEKLLPTWRINHFAQIAGIESLKDSSYISETRKKNRIEREFLYEGLKNIKGLKPIKSYANFILVDCRDTGYDVEKIEEYLGRRKILIRRCDTYPNLDKYYFRTAVKSRKENEILLEILNNFILGVDK